MYFHLSHCVTADSLSMARLEAATVSRRRRIELGSATTAAMRDHLSFYYPLIMEQAAATGLREVCLKVVEATAGMVAYAAWELPSEGPTHHHALPELGVPPLWGMNNGFVISLSRAELEMRNRVLKGRRSFVLKNFATSLAHQHSSASALLLSWPFEQADKEGAVCYVHGEEGGALVKACEERGLVRMDECRIDLTLGGLEGIYTHVAMVREPKRKLLKK